MRGIDAVVLWIDCRWNRCGGRGGIFRTGDGSVSCVFFTANLKLFCSFSIKFITFYTKTENRPLSCYTKTENRPLSWRTVPCPERVHANRPLSCNLFTTSNVGRRVMLAIYLDD